ncbi:MAG: SDR family NAD(P)-dependent oxidoreductase, partial [Solirubrobacteraceae bacterium]
RVVVVTGAASGQGRAEALALASEAATVVAADVEEFSPEGVHARRLDVADADGWEELAGWIEAEFGRVDGLINNAGVTSRVRLGEVELDDWNRVLAVNVTGAMLGIQALLPLMGPGASIVKVGSVAALTGHYTAAYTASKWALRGLTQCAAMELGPRGIRVNAVHPGYIDTPMTQNAPPAFLDANVALTPLGRAGEVGDVAALMVFLMSEDSSFITGAEIPVDGGFSSGASAKVISDALSPGSS